MTDREKVRIAGADRRADPPDFEEFFQSHHARLFGTLVLMIGDTSEAQDVTQEAFVRVWNRWSEVARHPDPAGYLFRTAFNIHRDRTRRLRRVIIRAARGPRAEDPFASLDEAADVRRALGVLSERQRTAVVLTDMLEMTSSEAAGLMGIRASTVRVLASQARSALREALGGSE